jgi:hypothetical protein
MDEWMKTANLPETAAKAISELKVLALADSLEKSWIDALVAFLSTCRVHTTLSFSPP